MTRRRSRKASRKKMAYHLQRGKQEVTLGFTIGLFFLMALLLVSLGFVLFQGKEVLYMRLSTDVVKLKQDILKLNNENKKLQAYIQSELMDYHRIATIARRTAGLQESVAPQTELVVDARKWQYYRQLDRHLEEAGHDQFTHP